MQIQCPYCESKYKVSQKADGKQVHCINPDCGHSFTASSILARQNRVRETVPASSSLGSISTVECVNDETPLLLPQHPSFPASSSEAPPSLPFSNTVNKDNSISDIADRYKKKSRPAILYIKQRLKDSIDIFKKRIRQWVLTRDIRKLYMAIDEQCGCLGKLVLQNRPAGIDVNVEIAELSQIQEKLAQNRMTLEALQKTKNSNLVAKDLKREIAQQEERQSVLMVEIGRRAEKSKVEMAGSAGHYSALERMHSSLRVKKTELSTFGEGINPIKRRKFIFS